VTRHLYQRDLAAIQAEAYGGHVEQSAPGLIARLRVALPQGARVVDLGCGAGDWLAHLGEAGFEAVGYDASPDLCAIARTRAPQAQVHCALADHASLEGAQAVTALGEIFNYLPPNGRPRSLATAFRRIHRALPTGGLFLFDLIVRGAPSLVRQGWTEGEDWLMAVSFEETSARAERRISVFQRAGDRWRRTDEVHRLRVPSTGEVLGALRQAGFRAQVRARWHEAALLPRRRAFVARKV